MKVATSVLLLFFLSFNSKAQCINERTSPFSAVKWEDEVPSVRVEDQWVTPVKFNDVTVDELIYFCKENYQDKWKKRFSEDFVAALCDMGKPPAELVNISWDSNGRVKTQAVQRDGKNRKAAVLFNVENPQQIVVETPDMLSRQEAIADVNQFAEIIWQSSSYVRVGDQSFEADVKQLLKELRDVDSIATAALARKIGIILGRVGDRHSSIRSNHLKSNSEKFLPFVVAPYKEGKVLALHETEEGYELMYEQFPLLTQVNGIPISEILEMSDYEEVRAPIQARHTRRVSNLSDIQFVFDSNNLQLRDSAEFTFSDLAGENSRSMTLQLSDEELSWIDIGSCAENFSLSMLKRNYEELVKVVDDVGYVALPIMVNRERDPGFFELLEEQMVEMKDTKAMVFDLRENGGGRRDLLRFLAPYFISPEAGTWVANMAKIRVDSTLNQDFDGAASRGLFANRSSEFSEEDRIAIDEFVQSFKPAVDFQKDKFSDYFYMVLNADTTGQKYYYEKPVYVLINEGSFSAASVFAAALKGLGKVKIAGVTSDGSSGMSKRFLLNNSWITMRLSRMISLQRNGYPLDGYGTEPDIALERDLDQILGNKDTQLQSLLKVIDGE